MAGLSFASIINPSPGSIISGVGDAGAAGKALGSQVIGGVQSGFSAAFGAGASLSQTLIGGFLSPLGQTGQALARATGAITNAIGDVFNAFLSGGKAIASLGGKIAAVGAGALLAGLGGAVGLIGGPAGALIGATVGSAIGAFLGKAVGAVGEFFGEIISAAGEAIGKIGALFGELGSSLVSILSDVAKTVSDVGGAVLRLQASGFSGDRAGKIVQTLGFFGQSPEKVAEQFGKPYATLSMGARAASVGLPNPARDLEGFLIQGAARTQQAARGGMQSAQRFQTRLTSAGFGDYAGTFAMGPDRVRKTLEVSKAFQANGAALGELGGDAQMATGILNGLGTQIKLVFAETLLPLLPMISRGFAYIVQNKGAIIGAIQTAGRWLVAELPPLLMRGAAGVLDAVSGLLGGFSSFTAGLSVNLDFILQQADSFLNGLREFAGVIAGVAAALTQAAANLRGNSPAPGSGAPGSPGTTTGAPGAPAGPGATIAPPATPGAPTPGNNAGGQAAAPATAGNAVPPGTGTQTAAQPTPTPTPGAPSGQGAPATPAPAPSNLGVTGGWKARYATALAMAGAGAWAGGHAGQVIGAGGGAIGGAILGAGAGGIGAIPGAALGATLFGGAGRTIGTIGGALYGAYKGWNLANNVQTNYIDPIVQGTPAPGTGTSPGAGAAPGDGASAGTNAANTAGAGAATAAGGGNSTVSFDPTIQGDDPSKPWVRPSRQQRAKNWIAKHPGALENPKKYGFTRKEVEDYYKAAGIPIPGVPTGAASGIAPTGAPGAPGTVANFSSVPGRSMADAYAAGQASFLTLFPASNLAGNAALKARAQGLLGTLTGASADGSKTAAEWAKSLREDADHWPDVLRGLDKIANAVNKNGDKISNAVGQGASGDAFASLEKRIARNAYLAVTR